MSENFYEKLVSHSCETKNWESSNGELDDTKHNMKYSTKHNMKYKADLSAISDIPVKLSVILGGKSMQIKNLLDMKKDDIIYFDKNFGEKVDIAANNKIIAKGEIIITNGKIGVTITEII